MGKSDQDLDTSMDALFARARGASAGGDRPGDDDDRAAAIVRAALAAGPLPGDQEAERAALDALSAPPDLLSEPGEPRSTPETSRAVGATSQNGSLMSDETPKPPSSRRPSLKDLAVSVKNRPSQSGRDSQPPSGPTSRGSTPSLKDTLVALDGKTPPPPPSSYDAPHSTRGPISSPPSSLGGGAPASAPPASGPGARASSPGPISSPAPASLPASSRPLALAPMPPTSNPNSVPSTKPSAGVHKPSAKQGSGMGLGVGIAVVGIAAAAAFAFWSKSTPTPTPTATVAEKTEGEEVAKAKDEGATTAVKQAEPEAKPDGVIDINQLADAAGTAAPATGPAVGGPLPGAPASSAVASKDPAKPAGPGEDLDEAIKNRAGGGSSDAEDAEPAAGDGARKNVADVPATGAVTSAINAVKGNAKGCVAGADEPSTATITFGSSGAVQSVTVGGWAQGKSAAGCIKSALQAARVPPFAKPTYSTSVTIRP